MTVSKENCYVMVRCYKGELFLLKFMFSKKATKIDKIFTVNLTVTTYCQTDGEDLVNFFAFSENVNFNDCYKVDQWRTIPKDE